MYPPRNITDGWLRLPVPSIWVTSTLGTKRYSEIIFRGPIPAFLAHSLVTSSLASTTGERSSIPSLMSISTPNSLKASWEMIPSRNRPSSALRWARRASRRAVSSSCASRSGAALRVWRTSSPKVRTCFSYSGRRVSQVWVEAILPCVDVPDDSAPPAWRLSVHGVSHIPPGMDRE